MSMFQLYYEFIVLLEFLCEICIFTLYFKKQIFNYFTESRIFSVLSSNS